jgi:hypothetical protein
MKDLRTNNIKAMSWPCEMLLAHGKTMETGQQLASLEVGVLPIKELEETMNLSGLNIHFKSKYVNVIRCCNKCLEKLIEIDSAYPGSALTSDMVILDFMSQNICR